LESEKRNIESQLATIAAVQDIGVSSDLIDKLIDEKEAQLNDCIVLIDKLELEKVDTEKMSADLKQLWTSMEEAINRVKDIETLLNRSRCDQIIKYETGIVEDLLKAKHDISNQLFSINKTLNNQQKYRDILDSEILPTSRNVRKEKDLLETVAKGLSPNSGLPCIYLTRFINRIIARANAFIREVWYYDMELVYLEEEADLDFSIGILIRHSTTVKDLSLLSMGQRAIVDLAVSLAICVERGWFDTYSMMADEVDAALTDEHRTRLVSMISRLLDENIIRQLFLVNHFAIQTGMHHCGSIVLSPEGIVLPAEYNKNCEIA
jgi:DNA repair exonuclease SbcCD ATPase subunit